MNIEKVKELSEKMSRRTGASQIICESKIMYFLGRNSNYFDIYRNNGNGSRSWKRAFNLIWGRLPENYKTVITRQFDNE